MCSWVLSTDVFCNLQPATWGYYFRKKNVYRASGAIYLVHFVILSKTNNNNMRLSAPEVGEVCLPFQLKSGSLSMAFCLFLSFSLDHCGNSEPTLTLDFILRWSHCIWDDRDRNLYIFSDFSSKSKTWQILGIWGPWWRIDSTWYQLSCAIGEPNVNIINILDLIKCFMYYCTFLKVLQTHFFKIFVLFAVLSISLFIHD